MYSINLDPTISARTKMKLYRNVLNVRDLRQRVMSGELRCCIVKPSLIVHPLQVIVAVNKALTTEKLKTRTVFTETLFNLSVSKNIAYSLKTFGVGDEDTDMLVIIIEHNDENNEVVFKSINCEESSMDELRNITNIDMVRKIYKINEFEMKYVDILDSVVSRIAAKDCML